MKPLPVNERFHTWQGEGVHTGKSAYFIRLQGCPVKCAWCDSAGTWHPDWVPKDVEKISPKTLAEDALTSGCEIVVLTGENPRSTTWKTSPLNFQRKNFPSIWKPVAVILSEVHSTG